jgi:hypothetical protein
VIRLRGPWQYRPLARTVLLADGSTRETAGVLPPPGRVHMPADWGQTLGATFRGRVQYRRDFGCPTGLEAGDRVELVIERVDAFGVVVFNTRSLGQIHAGGEKASFDVTSWLRRRNELLIEVELPEVTSASAPLSRPGREGLPGGLVGEVRIEIFAANAI